MAERYVPLQKDIDVLIAQDLSPAAQSKALADFARQELAQADDTNEAALGRVPPHIKFVDGVANVPEDTVRPDGSIVYEFELAQDMLAWIAQQLEDHSPVKTGRYSKSHALWVDGVEVNTDSPSIPEGQEYVFLSTVPYARKIEGDDNRAPQSSQAPDGVYEVVAALARRRFGNIAKISFGWRAPINMGGSMLEDWATSSSMRRNGRIETKRKGSTSGRDHWLRRQPAIIVNMR